jgi:hypothetical protein
MAALAAQIAELRARHRAVTITDEAFRLGPVESLDDTLGRIERGIFEQHRTIECMRPVVEAAEAVRRWQDGERNSADLDAALDGLVDAVDTYRANASKEP